MQRLDLWSPFNEWNGDTENVRQISIDAAR
jgi:hypothetical protein